MSVSQGVPNVYLAADHSVLINLAADDHLQYLLLAGRAGGQVAFGGTAAADDLDLAANTVGTGAGRINANSPIVFAAYSATTAAYGFDYTAVESFTGPFIGGGLNFSGTIAFSNGTFIYESFRGAPTITTGVAPGFAAYTVLQALPLLRAGAGAGFNPLAPLILNAGPTVENPVAAARTTATTAAINWASQVRTTAVGGTMSVTTNTGLLAAAKFSTVAGSTVNLGTIRGLWMQNPAPGLFQPSAGVETMTALVGLDVDAIPFGGTVTKAAVRSAIGFATNAWFLQNTADAWSDFGGGFAQWDDDVGTIFGSGLDVFIRWNSVQLALEYNTFFGIGNSPVFFRPNGDNSWDFFSINPLGLQYNVENVSFGTANAAPAMQNWFVNFTPIVDRQPNAAGSYTDVLYQTDVQLDLNGLAMTEVQATKVIAPSILLSGGSVVDASALVVEGNVNQGTNRYGLLVTSSPTGGTLNYAARFTGAAGVRVDGKLESHAARVIQEREIAGATTLSATTDHAVFCETTGGAFTVTLPAVANNAGLTYHIKNIGTNTLTVDGNAAETIDGATTAVLSSQYEAITIVCDGAEWWIV